jgi:copper oxidase (laccase) domain-containing protein
MAKTIRPDSLTAFYEGIHVYIGPAIGQKNYEVGMELKNLFVTEITVEQRT